jgi:hypothetical protein
MTRGFLLLATVACLARWASGAGEEAAPPAPKPSNPEAVCGTWVLQQADSLRQLQELLPTVLDAALATPGVRGFSLRVPWNRIDADFSLLEAGLKIARARQAAFAVRFMAGRHTPARIFDAGCRYYLRQGTGEKVPAPFQEDGSPNAVFEKEYEAFAQRLARWCRANQVRLLHMAWYGQDWAELNHGKDVRDLKGYTYENWLQAHARLIDIALKQAGPDLAVEFPLSGHGPLTQAAEDLADYAARKIGPWNPAFFFQANGWGPRGDWGAPTAETEAAFDRVWQKPLFRGEQAIQPGDYDWQAMFRLLRTSGAAYCEVYAPSFTKGGKDALARELGKFREECQKRRWPQGAPEEGGPPRGDPASNRAGAAPPPALSP